jgi:hypothetical protein
MSGSNIRQCFFMVAAYNIYETIKTTLNLSGVYATPANLSLTSQSDFSVALDCDVVILNQPFGAERSIHDEP